MISQARLLYLVGMIILCCGQGWASLIGLICWAEAFGWYMKGKTKND